ncbi:MAG TPA: enoyl-CoA hydratase-related protein [Spirochaetota bacterium]|nr:enoyl-CoA hydratase-related protein [Spirochaetota bacterium]HOM09383.1 enoyl-CoA hydratase-related protein [Spirochaetota bacterium]HPP49238.1 enoyl-CoA hydratase-related protein [Spirochaetota bacterium]
MGGNTVLIEINNFVATLTLNRPPTNSINMSMRVELDELLNQCENNNDVRVVIITGAGDKGFSAGMDVSDVTNLHNGPDAIELFNKIDRYKKPVIAAINGYALGGGCELALACHFRFMIDAPKAVIGCPEINLGITPGWGGIQRMARLLGRSKALELILLGKRLTAKEALEIGLIDKIFSAETFHQETMEFANQLAKMAPLAVQSILKGMITGIEKGIEEGLKVDRECSEMLAKTEDAAEGFMAFAQKREPVFKGR